MLPSILAFAMFAVQSSSGTGITPELACGPEYHEFSPPLPQPSHRIETTSIKEILSNDVAVEGVVVSRRRYFRAGVENDVKLRVRKLLKGSGLAEGDVITVHINGGYAPNADDNVCERDNIADGMRIEVGTSYLVSLTKEAETDNYRSDPQGGWFRISSNGDLIPLTPSLVRNKAVAGKRIADVEAVAKGDR